MDGEFQLVLMHEHKAEHKPHETAALTALITRGEDVVAGVVGNASNTMFAPAPLAIDVVLSNDGLQFGADIDRIWGWLLFPVSIAPRQIDSIREFLHPRAGIRLVDQSASVEEPVITDNSLPPLGFGGRVLNRPRNTNTFIPLSPSSLLRRAAGSDAPAKAAVDEVYEGKTGMVDRTLYTAWFDNGGGKGEDRTVAVLVANAESEEQMRKLFRERHGFEPRNIATGIVENEYTEFAISKPILGEAKLARLLKGCLDIEISVCVRLNGRTDQSGGLPDSSEVGKRRVR